MLTVYAVAPAAPAAGYAVVGLGLLLTFTVSYGLSHGWNATFGPFLRWLANLGIEAGHAPFRIDVHPFRFAQTLDKTVQRWLSQAMALSERGMSWAFGNAVMLIKDAAYTVEHLAERVYSAIHDVRHTITTTVPKVIRETVVKPTTRVITRTTRVVTVRVGNLSKAIRAAEAKIAHAASIAAHGIATTLPRLRDLERTAINTRSLPKWLKRHLTAILAGGVLTAALARLGYGFLRCSRFKRAGRQICGIDPDLFDSLLGATLLLTSAISLRDFARELEEPTQIVRDTLHTLIREV